MGIHNSEIQCRGNSVYWKTRKLGTIYPSESTFRSVSRTEDNLFYLFGGGRLGVNRELLYLLKELDIKYVEIQFCDETLKTSISKYLRGIPLPKKYCSDIVDLQLFLRPDQITLDENEPKNQIAKSDKQLSLQLGEV